MGDIGGDILGAGGRASADLGGDSASPRMEIAPNLAEHSQKQMDFSTRFLEGVIVLAIFAARDSMPDAISGGVYEADCLAQFR